MAGGTGTQPTPNSVLLPGSTRVSGRASALLGVAGPSLATHRPLLCGGPTYYGASSRRPLRIRRPGATCTYPPTLHPGVESNTVGAAGRPIQRNRGEVFVDAPGRV